MSSIFRILLYLSALLALQACSGTASQPAPDFAPYPQPDKGVSFQETSPPPPWQCGPPDCGGCCTSNVCATGIADNACGKGGGSCVDCTAISQFCNAGVCGEKCVPDCTGKPCDADDGCDGLCKAACGTDGCSNGKKDGSETDTDCGGSECSACDNGLACLGGTDCASGVCTNNKCEKCINNTTCPDGTFCNGQVCKGEGAVGAPCTGDSQCDTGHCANKVCCETDCSGACQACSVAAGAQKDGTCDMLGASTVCREAADGCDVAETCDGASAGCPTDKFAATTVTCNDGKVCTHTDHCDGAGGCTGTAISCQDTVCYTRTCNGTSTCTATRKATGTNCGSGRVCAPSGQCCRYVCGKEGCNYTSCIAG